MNRRQFMKVSGGVLASPAVQQEAARSRADTSPRPNILFIMTDQQWAGAMSFVGNPDVRTPNIDNICANGVVFDQAYCAHPLCVPSRTVMMTGRMPHETGITVNRSSQTNLLKVPMMGSIFRQAGYDCGYVGKWHLPLPAADVDYHGFSTISHAGVNNLDPKVPGPCVEFIAKPRTRPFLLVASFVNPHDICEWARGDAMKNGDLPSPPPPDNCPALPKNFEIPVDEPEVLREIQAMSKAAYPTVGWPAERWRQYRWAYYRLVEMVDARLGEILRALRETGQEQNTVVIFASDHGDGLAAHRWNQKQVLYEEVARVPFVVSWKGLTRPGVIDREHLVGAGQDLLPTMCDFAGIRIPEGLTGKSVRPLVMEGQTGASGWRETLVIETEFSNNAQLTGVRGRMLRSAEYKYIVYSRGVVREQLFNIRDDPGEMSSLVNQPGHRSLLLDHRRRLADWIAQTSDTFELPES